MMISKTPFEILFAHAPSQCTRAVASRLNGCPIPTTLKDIEDLKKKLDGVLKEGEWLAVEKAAKASRKELSAAFIEYDSVSIQKPLSDRPETDADLVSLASFPSLPALRLWGQSSNSTP